MNKLIVLFLIFLCAKYASAQDVDGVWTKTNATNINEAFHTNPYNGFVCGYERLKIEKDKICVCISPFDIGQTLTLSKRGSRMAFLTRKYKYKVSNDTLLLYDDFESSDINMQPMKYTYIRFNKVINVNISQEPLVEIVVDTLTIAKPVIFSSEKSFMLETQIYSSDKKYYYDIPTFIGGKGVFTDYLQNNIDFDLSLNDTVDFVYSEFHLTIDPKGFITDVGIDAGTNEFFNKKLYEVLTNKSNKWKKTNNKYSVKLVFPVKFHKLSAFKSGKSYHDYYLEGNKLYTEGKYAESISMYTKALQMDNDFVDAYFNRAAIYFETGDIDKACIDWQSIYKLGANDSYYLLIEKCQKKPE